MRKQGPSFHVTSRCQGIIIITIMATLTLRRRMGLSCFHVNIPLFRYLLRTILAFFCFLFSSKNHIYVLLMAGWSDILMAVPHRVLPQISSILSWAPWITSYKLGALAICKSEFCTSCLPFHFTLWTSIQNFFFPSIC